MANFLECEVWSLKCEMRERNFIQLNFELFLLLSAMNKFCLLNVIQLMNE